MNRIEAAGKNVDEAIKEGLKLLGTTLDEVDVKIVNEGGFFRKAQVILTRSNPLPERKPEPAETSKPVKAEKQPKIMAESEPRPVKNRKPQMEIVSVIEPEKPKAEKTVVYEKSERTHISKKPRFGGADATPEQLQQIVGFVTGLVAELNIDGAGVTVNQSESAVEVTIAADKASSIIGHRGECLQAIQTIVNAFVRTKNMHIKKVVVNTGGYRERREETLRAMAERLAKKALETKRTVRMDPMNAYERRIVHDALGQNPMIKTESYGSEPRRYISISPK
ncbi:MAG: KH domain-containing protein [Firmicutes bacterium]|nr:KH domain-containing protein [Bacillota bacterium]